MTVEVISIAMMYYAAGLLLAVHFFHNQDAWEGTPGEHGAAVVFGVFLFNVIWPVMSLVMMALSFRHAARVRQQSIRGVYYGEPREQEAERLAR
jgi:hypothetical protein